MADAANRLDTGLARDPNALRESREPGRRLIFDPPLSVVVLVREADRRVSVMAVGLSKRPRR